MDKLFAIFERLFMVMRAIESVIVVTIGGLTISTGPAYVFCLKSQINGTHFSGTITPFNYNLLALYFGLMPTMYHSVAENTNTQVYVYLQEKLRKILQNSFYIIKNTVF